MIDLRLVENLGEELSHLAPLCKGELLLQCEALPTIEGLSAEVLVKAERFGANDPSIVG